MTYEETMAEQKKAENERKTKRENYGFRSIEKCYKCSHKRRCPNPSYIGKSIWMCNKQ
jgi:hypothetical protein